MTRITRRRLIALAAAYAIALQAVLASFVVLSAAGAVPELCASSAPKTPVPDPGHAQACVGCPAFCGDGGPSGPAPAHGSVLVRHGAAVRVERGMPHLAERSGPRNLPPSRAPPSA